MALSQIPRMNCDVDAYLRYFKCSFFFKIKKSYYDNCPIYMTNPEFPSSNVLVINKLTL